MDIVDNPVDNLKIDKNYSKTVNLPKTSFSMKANLSFREPEIIKFWQENNIYKKIIDSHKNNTKFILHDGPPYANGNIHLGHALNKILKDIIIKYKTMTGYFSPYIPGWDCHGLPIEYQLLKALKIIDKKNINIIDFRQKARKFALKFVDIQKNEFIRLGVFGDWEKSYLTLSNEYEANIIRIFKELYLKGYIYRSKKPIYWCIHCETALADAEIEYEQHISPSIYVKFPLNNSKNEFVLIWTTTPWTLPANVALAFHPQQDYIYVDIGNEIIIVAFALLEKVLKETGIKKYKIIKRLKGTEFEHKLCQNPLTNRESKCILADFINMEEGTGIVHIAPGHGQEDYQIGLKYNLEILSPVNEKGIFTEEVKDFAGYEVFTANSLIINKLKSDNFLFYESKITHSYPYCWRCKHAVIFRATEQWFLNIEHNQLKEKMLQEINNVSWIPSYGKTRITGMIESRPDWCLSRQRFWGVPIPVIYCKNCKNSIFDIRIVEKFEQICKKENSDVWFDKSVEFFLPDNFKCEKCGKNEFRKEYDILDVWFDSGISHIAVLKEIPELSWPADMYCEGSDQHRGWFQTSLIPAVSLYDKPPYKTVLTHGFVVDGKGEKMSKSLGNVIAPQEIVKKYGSEILRLWVSSSDYTEDMKISQEIIERLIETYRKIRNTFRFLISNLYDFDFKFVLYNDLYEIDKYILYKLQILIKDIKQAYNEYQFYSVINKIKNFCINDLSGFYLDIIKDRLYTFKPDSIDRRACQTVIYQLLIDLIKLVSPVLSFTGEDIWQVLKNDFGNRILLEESVFLSNFPEVKKEYTEFDKIDLWEKQIIELRDKVNIKLEEARKQHIIGSSLEAKVEIIFNDEKIYEDLKKIHNSQKENLNMVFIVSQVNLGLDKTLLEEQIKISHAEGSKCQRCWNWSLNLKDGLCLRCQKVIKELGIQL